MLHYTAEMVRTLQDKITKIPDKFVDKGSRLTKLRHFTVMNMDRIHGIDKIVRDLCDEGFTDAEISEKLVSDHRCERGLSARSVRRWRIQRGLRRRCPIDDATALAAVRISASEIGPQSGRKYVKSYLRASGGPNIGEHRIGKLLKFIDPPNHECRRSGVSRRVNPRPYRANYFGDRIHIDQNEKITMYGVTHVIAIDGYSGYIVANMILPVRNNCLIYDPFFTGILRQHGLWNQVIADFGKEFCLLLAVQQSLVDLRRNQDRAPFLQVKSTKNNRVERAWVEINARVNYPIKDAMHVLVDRGVVNMSSQVHKYAVSVACSKVAAVGMARLIAARNSHQIAKRGVPDELRRKNNQVVRLTSAEITPLEDAISSYRRNGGDLTEPWCFGFNPQERNRARTQKRDDILSQFPLSPEDVYTHLINGFIGIFHDFVLHHVRTISAV